MNTPTTRKLRPRHVPTPKMSERKKDLFGSDRRSSSSKLVKDDEDFLLGPMELLESISIPLEYLNSTDDPFHYWYDETTDFGTLIEQLSPAIKNSCRISNSDDYPKKIIPSVKANLTNTKNMSDFWSGKENNFEQLLKTPVLSSNDKSVPKIYRKTLNSTALLQATLSPNSRKTGHGRNNDANAVDSPKAKTSLTFSEIPIKSFYGTAIDPILKLSAVEPVPISEKPSKIKPETTFKTNRYQARRLASKKPTLGSICKNNQKLKTKQPQNFLHDIITENNEILDQIHSTIDNARLLEYFKKLQSNKSDKGLLRGETRKFLEGKLDLQGKRKKSVESDGYSDDENSCFSEDEQEKSEDVQPKRKFFKSKTRRTENRYHITNSISATVKRGHGIKLLPPPKKKVKLNYDYDELLLVKKDVEDIIKRISATNEDQMPNDTNNCENTSNDKYVALDNDCSMNLNYKEIGNGNDMYNKYQNMIPFNTSDPLEIERQQTAISLLYHHGICTDENFKIFISEYKQRKTEAEQILNNLFEIVVTIDENSSSSLNDATMLPHNVTNYYAGKTPIIEKQQLYHIFYKDHRQPELKKSLLEVRLPKMFEGIRIPNDQLQIDAGQKSFGSKMCDECKMVYTLHVPEDEILHQNFHSKLSFKGWANENLVQNIENWGQKGRIIWFNQTDTKRHVTKIFEIMEFVNNELGSASSELPSNSIVYLAIARKLVIGVCVAEPLSQAHPTFTENGLEFIDYKTVLPVKCGISRIWVSQLFRGHGVATHLIKSVCSHFVRGITLSVEEIAFSSPTEMGRQFAQKINPKYLVYENIK